jgi:hypothetical protein
VAICAYNIDGMGLIRIPFSATIAMLKDLERLGKAWGLNRNSTIRHCIAICIKQEFGDDHPKR